MDSHLREQLVSFLTTAQAHMTFVESVKDFPPDRINEYPPNVDYTPWMLLEHMRLNSKVILDFMTDLNYADPVWPDEYWPKKDAKADEKMWKKTIEEYEEDMNKIVALVQDTSLDLTKKVEKGTGQTVLRELLLIIDHNSYHIGEFSILRQVMKTWPKTHEK